MKDTFLLLKRGKFFSLKKRPKDVTRNLVGVPFGIAGAPNVYKMARVGVDSNWHMTAQTDAKNLKLGSRKSSEI